MKRDISCAVSNADDEPDDFFYSILNKDYVEEILSHDGKHVAYKFRSHNKEFMVFNKKKYREFDEIVGYRYEVHSEFREVETSAVFSPDGRLSYYGRDGDKWFVIVGDFIDGPFDYINIKRPVLFSSDGSRFACVVFYGKHTSVIIDGEMSESYDSASVPVFSPEGFISYTATSGHKSFLIIDDFVYSYDYGKISYVKFSPVGKRTAWVVNYECYRLNENTLVNIKGIISDYQMKILKTLVNKDFFKIELLDEGFTEDETHIITRHSRLIMGKGFIVIDGVQSEIYDDINILDFKFSPDGTRYGYMARKGMEWFIVLDGVKQKSYENVYPVFFSPDSKRVAWKIKEKDKWYSLVDGIKGKPYDNLHCISSFTDIVFSPDGSSVAYSGENYERDEMGFYKCEYCRLWTITDDWYEIKQETMDRLKYKLPPEKIEFLKTIMGKKYGRETFINLLEDGNFSGEEMYFIMIVYYARYKLENKCSVLYAGQECKKRSKRFAVVNGMEYEFTTSGEKEPEFSPDGAFFIYKARRPVSHEWDEVKIKVRR